jgi:hypothetical protein
MHPITSPLGCPAAYVRAPASIGPAVAVHNTADTVSCCVGPSLNPLEHVPIQTLIRESCDGTISLLNYVCRFLEGDCPNLDGGTAEAHSRDTGLNHPALIARVFL